jgi:hypothetical protein
MVVFKANAIRGGLTISQQRKVRLMHDALLSPLAGRGLG